MELALTADSSWNRWHPTYHHLGRRAQRLAIGSLELAYYPQNEDFERAPEILDEYGVSIVAVNATAKWRPNLDQDPAPAQQQIRNCVNLVADCGGEYVVIYPGHNASWDFQSTVELTRRRLDPCFEAAKDRGVTLLLENHFDLRNEDPQHRDVVRDPDLTAMFFQALDCEQVKLNFDAGNVYISGSEPWPYAYRVLKEFIAYVHLKDMQKYSAVQHGDLRDLETLRDADTGVYVPVAVGDGGLNYWGMLREIAHDGVAKFAAFEDHSTELHQEEIIERGVAYARRAIHSLEEDPFTYGPIGA